jgi:hypothetical protein
MLAPAGTSLTQERRSQHGRRPSLQRAVWRRGVRHPGRSPGRAVVVPADPRDHRPVTSGLLSRRGGSTRPTAETAGPRTAPWRSWQRRRPARCAGSRRPSPSTIRRAHLAAGRATCSRSCGAGSGSWSSPAPASCRSLIRCTAAGAAMSLRRWGRRRWCTATTGSTTWSSPPPARCGWCWTGSCTPWATRWPPWSRPPPAPPSWPVDHHLKEPTSMRTSEAPVHAAIVTMTTMRMAAIQIHV